ncbi:CHRD domain-containing protein [Rhodoferax lacus]|uniref:CHRD domain-containing protein n=1 Tax=Rhodoferax lacus TaxID=2184758 RepID=A0A3E1R9T7_9BURK|nr:CHRD domain-containing protein [Rhodoferax lacus]RFO95981.1 CHRD domain-containing protein [Rhodoferax lacus]
MMKTRTFLSLSLITAALGLSACGSMMASNTTALRAKLSGANEVPANASAGSGALEASLDKQSNMLTWTVSYSGTTGPVKAGHFHGPAAAGANAGVALGFTGSVESPIKGSATLSAAQVADVLAGKWYVNLHTAANPGGELRGQVMPAQ